MAVKSKKELKKEEDFIKACDLWMVKEVREFHDKIKEYLIKAGVPQQFELSEEEASKLNLAGSQHFEAGQEIGISNYHEYGDVGKIGKHIIQNHLRKYEKELIKALKKQEHIKKANKKKRGINKIKHWINDNADSIVIAGIGVPAVLALAHIFGCAAVATKNFEGFVATTQENIQQVNQVDAFTGKAFKATELNNKYYLELYGTLKEKPEDKAIFSSMVYEIDKETYDFINKYFDVNFQFDQNAQLIGAENFMNNVFGFVKSNDIRREAYSKISDITANQEAVKINKFTEKESATEANYNVTVSYKNEKAGIDYSGAIGGAPKLKVNIDFIKQLNQQQDKSQPEM